MIPFEERFSAAKEAMRSFAARDFASDTDDLPVGLGDAELSPSQKILATSLLCPPDENLGDNSGPPMKIGGTVLATRQKSGGQSWPPVKKSYLHP